MWRRKLSNSTRSPEFRRRALSGAILALVLGGCSADRPEPLPHAPPGAFSVLVWRLGAYGLADRNGDGMAHEMKPDAECAAAADLIARLQPDLLCAQDLGGGEVFQRWVRDLESRGLVYEHVDHLHRGDGGLALFSRFPILESRSLLDHPYTIGDHRLVVTEGLIEADLDIGGHRVTVFVGQFKSKEWHPAGQTEMRRNEARILGNRIAERFKQDPEAEILAAVHLADEPGSAPWKEISRAGMNDLRPLDPYREAWTEWIADSDAYVRTDFLFASPSLSGRESPDLRQVIRHTWATAASPHRPLWAVFAHPGAAAPSGRSP